MSGITYRTPGPVADAYMQCPDFVCAIMGPYGSGKSTASIFKLAGRASSQPPAPDGWRYARDAVVRNTYPELKTTTLRTFFEWYPVDNMSVVYKDEGPPRMVIRRQLEDGSKLHWEVLFLALDRPEDARKLLSLELSAAWINEAREVSPDVLSNLQGRVGRYPSMNSGGCPNPQIILDTNPPDVDHWFYRLFEEQRPKGFRLFKQPSGRSSLAENIANLTPGYYDRAMLGQKASWVKVHVDGHYGYSQSGRPVFQNFDQERHISPDDLQPLEQLPIIIGADAGRTPAAIFMQKTAFGQLRILAELNRTNMSAKPFGDEINRLVAERFPGAELRGWGDPASAQRTESEERSWMRLVEIQTGIKFRAAPGGNRITPRLEAIDQLLLGSIEGSRPAFVVDHRCTMLIKGLISGYQFKRVNVPGKEQYRDEPDKNEYSHGVDALGYGILGTGHYADMTRRKDARAARSRPTIETEYDMFA